MEKIAESEWHRALDGDLPRDGERVIYRFAPLGVFVGTYTKGTYPAGTIFDEAVPADIFHSQSGYLTDEDVYWMPLPSLLEN